MTLSDTIETVQDKPMADPKNYMRTGNEYLTDLSPGRQIYIHGKKVSSPLEDPELAKTTQMRAEIYDALCDPARVAKGRVFDPVCGGYVSRLHKPALTKQDWYDKLSVLEHLFEDIQHIPCRVGDETVTAVWSMLDGNDFIRDCNPDFADNIERHLNRILLTDPFHVSGNADPKGNRLAKPEERDPDLLLRVVKETDAGIVVRGAKYETGAAYADQAFIKPTVANWAGQALSPYAVGFIFDKFESGNVKTICRDAYSNEGSGRTAISGRADEVEAMVVFDNELIPWENVFFYNDTRVADFVRGTLHRYSVFMFTARLYALGKLYTGLAYMNCAQNGGTGLPQVREKLAEIVSFKEAAHAFLVAAIETGSQSPAGYWMPNQAMMYSGRFMLCDRLHDLMKTCRELCGGQPPLTAGEATFYMDEIADVTSKYYTLSDEWQAERRHDLITLTNDMLNSKYANYRLNFYMFAHSPPFAQKNAIYNHHDFERTADFVEKLLEKRTSE